MVNFLKKLTNAQKNKIILFGIVSIVMLPMFIHLIQNMNAGISGADLIYKIVYAPVVLWAIWAAPQGRLYFEFFPEDEATDE
jgi:hypothetical protein